MIYCIGSHCRRVAVLNRKVANDANHVTTTALHAQRLRPCNLHSPLPLRINAIVDDHVAVAVVFAKLPKRSLLTTRANEYVNK